MTNNKNADVFAGASVNEGVRETSEGETAPATTGGCAQAGVQNQQLGNAFKFGKERASQADPALLPVERKRLFKLPGSFGMKGTSH